jgi:geranylgeranyl transferase type-1 subunit beta
MNKSKHVQFFQRHLGCLPHHYTATDASRMTLIYFCLAALELLGQSVAFDSEGRQACLDWIYAQQVLSKDRSFAGFRGSPLSGASFDPESVLPLINRSINRQLTRIFQIVVRKSLAVSEYDVPHLTMTYTAIASLLILRDDLSKLRKMEIIAHVKLLQLPDGRYTPCFYHSNLKFMSRVATLLALGVPKKTCDFCTVLAVYLICSMTGLE